MGFLDVFSKIFGDAGFNDPVMKDLGCEPLSEILPYEVFDAEKRLYFSDDTVGFIFEVEGQVTSDVLQNILGAIQQSMPNDAGFQVLNWTSPNISNQLNQWAMKRHEGGDVGEAMAAARIRHFEDLRFGSEHLVKSLPLERRRFIAGWLPGGATKSASLLL